MPVGGGNNVQASILVASLAVAIAVVGGCLYRRRRRQETPPTEWKAVGKVTKLHLYPLKSGRRLELKEAECTKFGLKQIADNEKTVQLYDRSFLIYGENNNEFKTARTFPKIILIELSVHDDQHIAFDAPGMRPLYVKLPQASHSKALRIRLHVNEPIFSLDCGDEAASWISRYIHGKPDGLRIGYHDAATSHSRNYAKIHTEMISVYNKLGNQSAGLYSDLTSVHVVNQKSVDDLNTKITSGNKVITENFRASITIDDVPAYAEDDWDWVKIGENCVIRNVKPTTRCVMTTINPETGIRNADREPLNTMEKYRRLRDLKGIELDGDSTVMGINCEVNKIGLIKLGDTVYVG